MWVESFFIESGLLYYLRQSIDSNYTNRTVIAEEFRLAAAGLYNVLCPVISGFGGFVYF